MTCPERRRLLTNVLIYGAGDNGGYPAAWKLTWESQTRLIKDKYIRIMHCLMGRKEVRSPESSGLSQIPLM